MKVGNLTSLILIVFAISWLGVAPSLLKAYGINTPAIIKHLDILMTLGPILGATIFIYYHEGIFGLKKLFRRLLYCKSNALVISVTLISPILFSFIASFVGLKLSNSEWPSSFDIFSIASNGLMIFAVYLIINTEEIVWRGIVFDKLFDRFGFVKSCLIIAPIWWLFHIPLFMYPEGHPAGYGLSEFSFMVIGQTFILGWIYIKSARSLLYVHIHHQLINGFGQAFPIFPIFIGGNLIPLWILCMLMLILAIGLVLQYYMSKKALRI